MSLKGLFGHSKGRENEDPNVKKLIRALKSKHWREREAAARALGKIGDVQAVKPLIDMLQNAYQDRGLIHAFAGVAKSPGLQSAVRLGQQIDQDKQKYAACDAAAESLAQIGDAQAIKPLIDFLLFSNAAPGIAASLVTFGERAVEQLSVTLKSTDPLDRMRHRAAVEVLGRIGGPSAIEVLNSALSHSEPSVREAAAKVLGNSDDKRAKGALTEE